MDANDDSILPENGRPTNMDTIRDPVNRAGLAIQTVWRSWLRPPIATIGRGNFHVDRMG